MSQRPHWERVYGGKPVEELGWYAPRLATSLGLIESVGLDRDAPIVDVGGGASTLVDDLLETGYRSVTVVDISETALRVVKRRLGSEGELVQWLVGDITSVELPRQHFELWHDRAVFHFLTEEDQQRKYRNNLLKALKPAGHLVIATFAPEAPPRCSGLPVQRYSRERLEETLGTAFELVNDQKELHVTPAGVEQMYLYCLFRRVAG